MSSAICDISSLLLIESFNRILALRISFSFFKKKKKTYLRVTVKLHRSSCLMRLIESSKENGSRLAKCYKSSMCTWT